MAKTYRSIQRFEHWLNQFLGHRLLEAEKKILQKVLIDYFGKHCLLIGVPSQDVLLKTSVITYQVLLTPLISKIQSLKTIETELNELPIATGSVDLVLLPHTLEYLDNPRRLLSEACRIVKPEGHIIILGFNPFSFVGLAKLFTKNKKMLPWSLNFIKSTTLKKWLNLADFELIKQEMVLFFNFPSHRRIFYKFKFLEWIGRKYFKPLGGVYVLIAQAKMIPLTPIRLRWQQKISDRPITIPYQSPTRVFYK